MTRKKTKIDPTIQMLYRAVEGYVKKHSGSVIVIGGITIQQWPHDRDFTYYVAVKCTGRKPHFKNEVVKTTNLAG